MDDLPSEKQQRLLTEPLYSSWSGPGDGRPFLAAANVGIFSMVRTPGIVPDMFLSLDVAVAEDWWQKARRACFLWEFGKPANLILAIVSNGEGGEDREKKFSYQRVRVIHYVIYDPLRQAMPEVLTVHHLQDATYQQETSARFPLLGLGPTLWEGVFQDKRDTWLCWTGVDGALPGRNGPNMSIRGRRRRTGGQKKNVDVPKRNACAPKRPAAGRPMNSNESKSGGHVTPGRH